MNACSDRFIIVPFYNREVRYLSNTATVKIGDAKINSNTTVARKITEQRGKRYIER